MQAKGQNYGANSTYGIDNAGVAVNTDVDAGKNTFHVSKSTISNLLQSFFITFVLEL